MRRLKALLILLSISLLIWSPWVTKASAQEPIDTPEYKVALLTCGPSDLATFMLYGHTAIRIWNTNGGEDYVFNYGLFSFDQPNFLMNFALGKPLYALGASPTTDFIEAYKYEGRSVTQQVLNLSPTEVREMYDFLQWNALPENRDYIYNFYFDNCSTKPRDLIEKFSKGMVILKMDEMPTFRSILRHYTRTDRWYTFLCELPLGAKTDRVMSVSEAAFLPLMLEQELDRAVRSDNNEPLVREKTLLVAETRPVGTKKDTPFTPTTAIIGILLLYALLVMIKPRVPYALNVYRSLLFVTISVCGIILWFLGLISHHPHTFPNLNMLLFTPLYLPLAITIWFSQCKRVNNWLYFINFVGIFLCAVGVASGYQTLPEGMTILFGLICVDHALYSGVLSYIKSKRQ